MLTKCMFYPFGLFFFNTCFVLVSVYRIVRKPYFSEDLVYNLLLFCLC